VVGAAWRAFVFKVFAFLSKINLFRTQPSRNSRMGQMLRCSSTKYDHSWIETPHGLSIHILVPDYDAGRFPFFNEARQDLMPFVSIHPRLTLNSATAATLWRMKIENVKRSMTWHRALHKLWPTLPKTNDI
jgi:hypothetical protein